MSKDAGAAGGIRRGQGAETGDEQAGRPSDASSGGSGVRGIDDGPAGQPTADPGAGLTGSDEGFGAMDEVDGLTDAGSGGIDDLSIVSEDDPSLGLTEHGDVGPDDWAAASGPARNPDRGVYTDNLADTQGTLSPDRDPD